MPRIASIVVLFACLLIPSAALIRGGATSATPVADADLIFVDGKIITMDAKDSVVQALAIRQGKILLAGTNEEVRGRAAKNSRILDLHGLTVTPGLIDTHCHFDETTVLYDLELSQVKSISEVLDLA